MTRNSHRALETVPTLTKEKERRRSPNPIKELRVDKEAALWLDNLTLGWGQRQETEEFVNCSSAA